MFDVNLRNNETYRESDTFKSGSTLKYMNIFYVEILDLLPGNQHHAQIQLIHHFGTYVPKKMETHEADTNMDQINEIYDEFNEDPLNGDFEELDEDLY